MRLIRRWDAHMFDLNMDNTKIMVPIMATGQRVLFESNHVILFYFLNLLSEIDYVFFVPQFPVLILSTPFWAWCKK